GGRRPRQGADRRAGRDPAGLPHLAIAPDPRQGRWHPRRPPRAAPRRRSGPAGTPRRPARPSQPASDGPLTDRPKAPPPTRTTEAFDEAPPRRTGARLRLRAGPAPHRLRRLK